MSMEQVTKSTRENQGSRDSAKRYTCTTGEKALLQKAITRQVMSTNEVKKSLLRMGGVRQPVPSSAGSGP